VLDVPVTVLDILPFSGPQSGATIVTIGGSNFTDTKQITVSFTNGTHVVTVPATYIDHQHVVCNTTMFPTEGMYSTRVALNGQQYTTTSVNFFVYGTDPLLITLCLNYSSI